MCWRASPRLEGQTCATDLLPPRLEMGLWMTFSLSPRLEMPAQINDRRPPVL